MPQDEVKGALAQKIEAAEPEELPQSLETGAEEDTFNAIVADIVTGETTPSEVEERLIGWANRQVDIPLVPEPVEERILRAVKGLLVQAAIESAERYLQSSA